MKLGEMLIRDQLITEQQLQQALDIKTQKKKFLGEVLVEMNFISEKQLVDTLMRQTSAAFLDLGTVQLDKNLVKTVPWVLARKTSCVPVKMTGNMLHIAMADPSDTASVDNVAFQTGKTIKTFISGILAIKRAWDELYGADRDDKLLATSMDGLKKGMDKKAADYKSQMALVSKDYSKSEDEESKEDTQKIEQLDVNRFDEIVSGALGEITIEKHKEEDKTNLYGLSVAAEAPPIIKLVNGILIKSMEMNASDIHIEPFEKEFRIRFRIDGVLHVVMKLPINVKNSVVSRIKIMSDLDIAERRIPQDGRVRIRLGKTTALDMRVSTLPTVFGEKIVIRLLGQSNLQEGVHKLGFSEKSLKYVETALHSPYGMILVTGPTGSGKSTTLYTALSQLNSPERNITTAEDPVEYNVQGIVQVQVNANIGYTFEMALRAFLRQDPDIIMVGEMRDYETAAIGVKAALTGHLVLSTLHTNDSASTVTRLVDMGLDSFMVATATKVVIAQRLCRKLCAKCRNEGPPHEQQLALLADQYADASVYQDLRVFHPKGCGECNNIGYRGRLPVFEVLFVANRAVRQAVINKASSMEIANVAKEQGMENLRDSAFSKVKEGLTTLDEMFKVTIAD